MVNLKKANKRDIGKILLPKKIYRLNFKEELDKLHQKLYNDKVNSLLIFYLFSFSILASLVTYIVVYPYFLQVPLLGDYLRAELVLKTFTVFISYFVWSIIVYYIILLGYFLRHDSRYKKNEFEIEKDLPEFIDNLVSNLKGGISFEKALLKSVRKEQRVLKKEVTLMNEKVMMGKSSHQVLKEFRNSYNSPIISRTVFLMEEGIKGGGNLAAPLARISQNLKRIYALDEEIKGNSSGFSIVISAITLLVAPLLFALALTLLTFIGGLFELLSGVQEAQFSFAKQIPEEFPIYLEVFSYFMIILITFFSSMITSQLKNEKVYTALKYLPIYIVIALFLFKIFSDLLLNFFGNII